MRDLPRHKQTTCKRNSFNKVDEILIIDLGIACAAYESVK